MANGELPAELNFKLGLVTARHQDRAQILMLHSREISNPEFYDPDDEYDVSAFKWVRGAIDTDAPEDFEQIEILEHIKGDDIAIPELLTTASYADVWREGSPEGVDFDQLQPGTIIHKHLMEGGPVYCVNPVRLTQDGLVAAVDYANQLRRERIQGKIDSLIEEEPVLFEGLEVKPMGDGLRLFEGATRRTSKRGFDFIEVPDRAIYSERYGFQKISVSTWPEFIDGTPDEAGRHRYTTGGTEFWIPNIFPFEEVDERGVPVGLDPSRDWVRIEIAVSNPLRCHKPAMEEEKLIMQFGSRTFWAKPNPDMLAGNQGFGGIDFMDFHDVDQPDRYYEVRVDPNQATLPALYRDVDIVVAVDDIDLLREVIVRLPGFES